MSQPQAADTCRSAMRCLLRPFLNCSPMHASRLTVCIGTLAVAFGVLGSMAAGAEPTELERNAWPVAVERTNAKGTETQWAGAGPLAFGQATVDGGRVGGFRPFWVEWDDAKGNFRSGTFLYPLFSYRLDENTYQWNVFELIRRTDRRSDAKGTVSRFEDRADFEIWPFWFSRQTGDPELSYRALFPVAGTIKNKLGFEEAKWFAFPLHMQTRKKGVVTDTLFWPIVRVTKGEAHGFGVWPLFEIKERPGRWHQETYLWPLGYNNTTYPAPDAPAGTAPTRDIGVLPLYARRTAPGYIDQNVLWPFFGYTDRTQPRRYHETRYFWPLLVQGRGDDRYVNRWGPFYTHSVVKGYDKTWYLWPVLRHAEWNERGLAIEKTQVLFFVYSNEQQRSEANPGKAAGSVTHLWPLFSNWDNGAGRRQFQLLSPFEVLFPGNEKVRAAWSPLVSVLRYERAAPGETQTSLLWNAVTWRRNDAQGQREFHLGPLFSVSRQADARRIAIGSGLISLRRQPDTGWKLLWLDFAPKPTTANQPR